MAGSPCPSHTHTHPHPKEKGTATRALCPSSGGHRPSLPHTRSPHAASPGPPAALLRGRGARFLWEGPPQAEGRQGAGRGVGDDDTLTSHTHTPPSHSHPAIFCSRMTSGGCCCAEAEPPRAERLPAAPRGPSPGHRSLEKAPVPSPPHGRHETRGVVKREKADRPFPPPPHGHGEVGGGGQAGGFVRRADPRDFFLFYFFF